MAKKYKDEELQNSLDLMAKKLKPLVDKVADTYGIKIGYEINWMIKDEEDGSEEQK